MKYYCILFLIFVAIRVQATTFYVSDSGSNSNNGLSITTPFRTLQFAANSTNPGDIVLIMNGIYTNSGTSSNVLDIYRSGTANNWIIYKNYPNHTPIIQLAANNWAGIQVQGADYIQIEGITVIGNNDNITLAYAQSQQTNTNNSSTSGNGIGCAPEFGNTTNKTHHLKVKNCIVKKCGGGGIYTNKADYITFENNVISECAWYSPYGNSAITLYQNWNSDSSTAIKNFVIGNTCYRNEEYIPFVFAGSITDGNGIIIDDGRNTQNGSTLGVYMGQTYVANNLVFDNGGRGIHGYLSDNVIVVNNTCYKNCQSPSVPDGELTANQCNFINFINNISNPKNGIAPLNISNSVANFTIENNLWAENANLSSHNGTNTVIGNPNFINASSADFHLQNTSSAINVGSSNQAPITDKDGNSRINSVDIGCFEYQTNLYSYQNNLDSSLVILFPNPALHTIYVKLNLENWNELGLEITSILGQKVFNLNLKSKLELIPIDISNFESGIYFLHFKIDNQTLPVKTFFKE